MQVMVYKTITKWTFDGLFERFSTIQQFYKIKRNAMVAAAEKHLTGLAEWYKPTAGMFLWIHVKVLKDVRHLVTEECIRRGVLFVTGHAYIVKQDVPCPYLRASFSLPTLQEIDEGMARLADAIREEMKTEGTAKRAKLRCCSVTEQIEEESTHSRASLQLLRQASDGFLSRPLRGLSGT